VNKNPKQFWKSWKTKLKNGSNDVISVAGQSDPDEVVTVFRDSCASIYVDSSSDLNSVSEFNKLYSTYVPDLEINKPLCCIDVENLLQAVNAFKLNKSCGADGISAEHLIYAPSSILIHFKLLFTMIINHSYVPNALVSGIIVPIVKDKCGDCSSPDNYKPITLSPIISKIFESVLLAMFADKLLSNDLQFGFKKKIGCFDTIFV